MRDTKRYKQIDTEIKRGRNKEIERQKKMYKGIESQRGRVTKRETDREREKKERRKLEACRNE